MSCAFGTCYIFSSGTRYLERVVVPWKNIEGPFPLLLNLIPPWEELTAEGFEQNKRSLLGEPPSSTGEKDLVRRLANAAIAASYQERAVFPEEQWDPETELLVLLIATRMLLFPAKERPSERFAMMLGQVPYLPEIYSEDVERLSTTPLSFPSKFFYLWHRRQEQAGSVLVGLKLSRATRRSGDNYRQVTEKCVAARRFISPAGILPLLWAELAFAVEHDIFLRHCEVCGKLFQVNPLQRGQQKRCSTACTSEAKRRKTRGTRPDTGTGGEKRKTGRQMALPVSTHIL